jgi:hypothetical protein
MKHRLTNIRMKYCKQQVLWTRRIKIHCQAEHNIYTTVDVYMFILEYNTTDERQ